jgi:hypothetical protein
MFYVLDGDFAFVVEDRTSTRSTGFVAYLHRNVYIPKYGIELHPESKGIPDANIPPTIRAYWVLCEASKIHCRKVY